MSADGELKTFLKSFGARVRKLRVDRGWTLEEAEGHGWPAWRHLQKIEAGKNITLVTLWRLSRFFKVHPADLLRDRQSR
jgi:transcriptional regulator with XRE-family HTH domain